MAREINRKLQAAIYMRDMTQETFARRLGVTQAFVSYVINGHRTLGAEDQERWAKELGYTVEEMFNPGVALTLA